MHLRKFWNCPCKTRTISKFLKIPTVIYPKNRSNQTCDYWLIIPNRHALCIETNIPFWVGTATLKIFCSCSVPPGVAEERTWKKRPKAFLTISQCLFSIMAIVSSRYFFLLCLISQKKSLRSKILKMNFSLEILTFIMRNDN